MEIVEQYDDEYKTICRVCMSATENSYFDIFGEDHQINISEEIFFVTNLEV